MAESLKSSLISETAKLYSLGLLVRHTSGSPAHRVSFYSLQQQLVISDWVTLVDIDDVGDLSDTEKMVLLDCNKPPLLNSLATLSSDNLVVAVLCVCREVTEKELKISADELLSGEHPPVLFLVEETTDVIDLKQLLLFNPLEVECSVSEDLSTSISHPPDVRARPRVTSTSLLKSESFDSLQKSTIREYIKYDSLDQILFIRERVDDMLPLTLCNHPEVITLILLYIHQNVDSHARAKKEKLRNTSNKIVKYLKSRVIFEAHIQIDWPIYLVIFLEIAQLYDGTKDNLANEAIGLILARFLKTNPTTIASSIKRFSELVQDRVYKFRKLESPINELINLFTIEYTQYQKSGNKYNQLKPIYKQKDLENKLLWYNVLMLCNQSFKIPDHAKWGDHLIRHIDHDQLSIYDLSNLNIIWEFGIQFGLNLGLSFEQRFLLSHVVRIVSSKYESYSFQNFNIVLDYILKYQYDTIEIVDFCCQCYLFLEQYSKSIKKHLKSLLADNPKACVEMMCIILSKLATLICTATGISKQLTSQHEIIKKYWFDICNLLLYDVVCYYLYELYHPEDFSIVLRCFYDTVKIPTEPEELVRPWIKEHKKQVVLILKSKCDNVDIETFHEILKKFPVAVLSKSAIYDYFTKYQPSTNFCIKDQIWQDLLVTVFKGKDPPKSIFLSFEKILDQYLHRKSGLEFICDCLAMDLPPYGLEYKPTDGDKMISDFMAKIEFGSRNDFWYKLHASLIQILNYIPKLRMPSLLQATIMESVIRAIVPDSSILSHSSKDGYCNHLIASLQTLSYQKNHTTFEQIESSYEHYYLWKLLALICKKIKFEKLFWSDFPYMVTTLLFVYKNYKENVPGFQGYAWQDNNLVSYIEFCKKSEVLISRYYQSILNEDCSLIEYTEILNNIQNLNSLFLNCQLPILGKETLQTKIHFFTDTAKGLITTLFLQLEVENANVKSCFILQFLNDLQVEVSEGIRSEIDTLLRISFDQILDKSEQHISIPIIEARDTIKLNEFKTRCAYLVDNFRMFTSPIFEGSDYTVHNFLAHFSLRENVLFDACLRKCIVQKLELQDKSFLSMSEFVECLNSCYQSLSRICRGYPSLADIEHIWREFTLEDFPQTENNICAVVNTCHLSFRSLFLLQNDKFTQMNKLNDQFIYPYMINQLCNNIHFICNTYDPNDVSGKKMLSPSKFVNEHTLPNNIFQVLQFLNLLPKVYLPNALVTTDTSTTLANILVIYSKIYNCLNIDQVGDFFNNNLAISLEIIHFQLIFNNIIQSITIDESRYPDLKVFMSSCPLMQRNICTTIQLFNSKELFKSQLQILTEYLDTFNSCVKIQSDFEQIKIETLNSQITEFEVMQKDTKNLLFFNNEFSPDECSENSLLIFLKKYLVCIPRKLEDCTDSILFHSEEFHLKQLTETSDYIKDELLLLSEDVLEFISFFITRSNILFLFLLRHTTAHKLNQLPHLPDVQLDISQFVQCVHETYQQIHSMCIGDYTFTHVQAITGIYSITSKDLAVIEKDLSEFPKFSCLLADGFLSLCLFELHVFSRYIPSIVKLCENFDLRVCLNSFDYKSLYKHSYNLHDLKYCERITILMANQLMKDIKQLINNMTIPRMKLIDTVSRCKDVFLVLKKLNLKEGRISLENIQSKILNNSQLAEHHSLVSNILLLVYDALSPLFVDNINFNKLMIVYSTLHIPDEEEASRKLEQFLSNINIFRTLLV